VLSKQETTKFVALLSVPSCAVYNLVENVYYGA